MKISLEAYEKLLDRIEELMLENERLRKIMLATQQWISVKDRLPNFDQTVLVYSGKKWGIGLAFLHDDEKWYGDCEDVTHWIPLPAPPEVEDNEAD